MFLVSVIVEVVPLQISRFYFLLEFWWGFLIIIIFLIKTCNKMCDANCKMVQGRIELNWIESEINIYFVEQLFFVKKQTAKTQNDVWVLLIDDGDEINTKEYNPLWAWKYWAATWRLTFQFQRGSEGHFNRASKLTLSEKVLQYIKRVEVTKDWMTFHCVREWRELQMNWRSLFLFRFRPGRFLPETFSHLKGCSSPPALQPSSPAYLVCCEGESMSMSWARLSARPPLRPPRIEGFLEKRLRWRRISCLLSSLPPPWGITAE